jgi:hypothetical protein
VPRSPNNDLCRPIEVQGPPTPRLSLGADHERGWSRRLNKVGIREAFVTVTNVVRPRPIFRGKVFQLQAAPRGKRKGLNNRWHFRTPVARTKPPPPACVESIEHADRELDERTIACGLSVASQPGLARRIEPPLTQAGVGRPVPGSFHPCGPSSKIRDAPILPAASIAISAT